MAGEADSKFVGLIISGISSPWELLKYNISHVTNLAGEVSAHPAPPRRNNA